MYSETSIRTLIGHHKIYQFVEQIKIFGRMKSTDVAVKYLG